MRRSARLAAAPHSPRWWPRSVRALRRLRQVYATDAEEGVAASFVLTEAADYWEVPIEGHGPPENPVPGACPEP